MTQIAAAMSGLQCGTVCKNKLKYRHLKATLHVLWPTRTTRVVLSDSVVHPRTMHVSEIAVLGEMLARLRNAALPAPRLVWPPSYRDLRYIEPRAQQLLTIAAFGHAGIAFLQGVGFDNGRRDASGTRRGGDAAFSSSPRHAKATSTAQVRQSKASHSPGTWAAANRLRIVPLSSKMLPQPVVDEAVVLACPSLLGVLCASGASGGTAPSTSPHNRAVRYQSHDGGGENRRHAAQAGGRAATGFPHSGHPQLATGGLAQQTGFSNQSTPISSPKMGVGQSRNSGLLPAANRGLARAGAAAMGGPAHLRGGPALLPPVGFSSPSEPGAWGSDAASSAATTAPGPISGGGGVSIMLPAAQGRSPAYQWHAALAGVVQPLWHETACLRKESDGGSMRIQRQRGTWAGVEGTCGEVVRPLEALARPHDVSARIHDILDLNQRYSLFIDTFEDILSQPSTQGVLEAVMLAAESVLALPRGSARIAVTDARVAAIFLIRTIDDTETQASSASAAEQGDAVSTLVSAHQPPTAPHRPARGPGDLHNPPPARRPAPRQPASASADGAAAANPSVPPGWPASGMFSGLDARQAGMALPAGVVTMATAREILTYRMKNLSELMDADDRDSSPRPAAPKLEFKGGAATKAYTISQDREKDRDGASPDQAAPGPGADISSSASLGPVVPKAAAGGGADAIQPDSPPRLTTTLTSASRNTADPESWDLAPSTGLAPIQHTVMLTAANERRTAFAADAAATFPDLSHRPESESPIVGEDGGHDVTAVSSAVEETKGMDASSVRTDHKSSADDGVDGQRAASAPMVVRASLAAPIFDADSGRLYGVLEIHSDESDRFVASDKHLLEAFASTAARCIRGVGLLVATRTAVSRSAKLLAMTRHALSAGDLGEVVMRIVKAGYELVPASRVSVFLVDYEAQELVLTVSEDAAGIHIPIGAGLAGAVATSGKIENIPDAYEDPRFNQAVDKKTNFRTKSVLAVPVLTTSGEVVAVIQAINRKDDEPFTAEDTAMLKAVANAAAVALTQARLLREAHDETDKALALVEASAIIEDADRLKQDLYAMLRELVNRVAVRLVPSDKMTLFLVDEIKGDLVFRVTRDEGEGLKDLRIPIGFGIAGTVALTKKLENIADAYEDTRFTKEVDKKTGYRTRTMLVIPIIDKNTGRVVAVLQAINKRGGGRFTATDERIFTAFAKNIASAVAKRVMQAAYDRVMGDGPDDAGDDEAALQRSLLSQFLNRSESSATAATASATAAAQSHRARRRSVAWGKNNRSNFTMLGSEGAGSGTGSAGGSGRAGELSHDASRRTSATTGSGGEEGAAPLGSDFLAGSRSPSRQPSLGDLRAAAAGAASPTHPLGQHPAAAASASSSAAALPARPGAGWLPVGAAPQRQGTRIMPRSPSPPSPGSRQPALLPGSASGFAPSTSFASVSFASSASAVPQAPSPPPPGSAASHQTGLTPVASSERLDAGQSLALEAGRDIWPGALISGAVLKSPPLSLPDGPVPFRGAWGSRMSDLAFNTLAESSENLARCILDMCYELGLVQTFRLDSRKLLRYGNELRARYRDNPYHNFAHGVSVAQVCFVVARRCRAAAELMTDVDRLALILAAVAHDVEHPGWNNAFEVATMSPLAIRYNDISVLENHHAATMFRILDVDGTDVVGDLPPEQFVRFRKVALKGILATDMAHHGKLVERARELTADLETSFPGDPVTKAFTLAEFVMHTADVCNPALPDFEVVRDWAQRVAQEFTNQAEMEREHGMTPLPHTLGLDDPHVMSKGQVFFASSIVRPLYAAVTVAIPELIETVENIDRNVAAWKAVVKATAPKPTS